MHYIQLDTLERSSKTLRCWPLSLTVQKLVGRVPRVLGMRPKGQLRVRQCHKSIKNGQKSIKNGHQSIRNGPQGSGKSPLVVLRCFQWLKDVPWDPQSIAKCSQQVIRCSQGDGRCSQGAGLCVKSVLIYQYYISNGLGVHQICSHFQKSFQIKTP